MALDVVTTRRTVVNTLVVHGYRPGDADGADFRNPERPHVRFKVGTVYGEVTVTCWDQANRQFKAIRILNDDKSLEEGLIQIEALINSVARINGSERV